MKIGIGMLLFIIFMVLKLTNYIDWPWWWVSAPLWVPLALAVVFALIGGFFYALAWAFKDQ